MSTTLHRGRFTRADQAASPYRYLPFEVPRGTGAVSVRLRYDQAAATLDLGLFDPEGFRGWSGGARTEFVVGTDHATPGYLPGPLPPGEWQVAVRLYRIPEDGVAYELEAETGATAPALPPSPLARLPERPPRRVLPAAPGHRWLAGDLHSHTEHSDGELSVDELACLARGQGLDFLAVTDHNTVSHYAELAPASRRTGVLLLPGQEVTTPEGHANLLGSPHWMDFRRPPAEWLTGAAEAGALLSINHPVRNNCAWQHPLPHPADLVEAWHGSWDRHGYQDAPPGWWRRFGHIPVGGSDFHRPTDPMRPGTPTTWIEAEIITSAGGPGDALGSIRQAVLDALRAGRVTLSATPTAPLLLRHDGDLVVTDGAGTTLHAADGRTQPVTEPWLRVPDQPGLWRLTTPDGKTVAALPT